MTSIIDYLRNRARRYRELAQSYDGEAAASLYAAAEQLEREAGAYDAYATAARLMAYPSISMRV